MNKTAHFPTTVMIQCVIGGESYICSFVKRDMAWKLKSGQFIICANSNATLKSVRARGRHRSLTFIYVIENVFILHINKLERKERKCLSFLLKPKQRERFSHLYDDHFWTWVRNIFPQIFFRRVQCREQFPFGEALDLPVDLHSNHHLWLRTAGSDQKNG